MKDRQEFSIIPVIDLKEGRAVQAFKGERETYLPLQSCLTKAQDCQGIMKDLQKSLATKLFYIADLDAIMSYGQNNQFHCLPVKSDKQTAEPSGSQQVSLMLDAGIRDSGDIAKVIESGADQFIIGTETLASLAALQEIVQLVDTERLIVSIDIQGNRVLSPDQEIASLRPEQAIMRMAQIGIHTFILLQLSSVGTSAGLNKELLEKCLVACNEMPAKVTSMKNPPRLILGGGVSGYEDLQWLKANGVCGALVATVLHNGLLSKEMIKQLQGKE